MPTLSFRTCGYAGSWQVACLLLLVGCDPAAPGPAAENAPATVKPLALVVSGDTRGWLSPCGCTSNQSGGLLRRATYVAGLRAHHDVLLCDAGGAPGGDSTYDRLRFDAILHGERAMGVAAHNLGAAELALGPGWLRETARATEVPFVAANATAVDGQPLAPASRTIQRGGVTVRVIGVVSPTFATAEIRVSDPAGAVLEELQRGVPVQQTVVLAWLPESELRELAQQLPEVDVIVGGPTGQSIVPEKVGRTWLAAATNKGKFVVEMSLTGKTWSGTVVEMSTAFADEPGQQKLLDQFRADLADRDLPAAETSFLSAVARNAPADFRVAGSASCRACHVAEMESWHASGHGHAWQTLEKTGAHVDAACQACHTTSFGFPGGFATRQASADRVDVGCESCHGPSERHVHDPQVRTPFRAAEQCQSCHDPENSPGFEFAAYWERIRHGGKAPREVAP